jgi:hypothetical protein
MQQSSTPKTADTTAAETTLLGNFYTGMTVHKKINKDETNNEDRRMLELRTRTYGALYDHLAISPLLRKAFIAEVLYDYHCYDITRNGEMHVGFIRDIMAKTNIWLNADFKTVNPPLVQTLPLELQGSNFVLSHGSKFVLHAVRSVEEEKRIPKEDTKKRDQLSKKWTKISIRRKQLERARGYLSNLLTEFEQKVFDNIATCEEVVNKYKTDQERIISCCHDIAPFVDKSSIQKELQNHIRLFSPRTSDTTTSSSSSSSSINVLEKRGENLREKEESIFTELLVTLEDDCFLGSRFQAIPHSKDLLKLILHEDGYGEAKEHKDERGSYFNFWVPSLIFTSTTLWGNNPNEATEFGVISANEYKKEQVIRKEIENYGKTHPYRLLLSSIMPTTTGGQEINLVVLSGAKELSYDLGNSVWLVDDSSRPLLIISNSDKIELYDVSSILTTTTTTTTTDVKCTGPSPWKTTHLRPLDSTKDFLGISYELKPVQVVAKGIWIAFLCSNTANGSGSLPQTYVCAVKINPSTKTFIKESLVYYAAHTVNCIAFSSSHSMDNDMLYLGTNHGFVFALDLEKNQLVDGFSCNVVERVKKIIIRDDTIFALTNSCVCLRSRHPFWLDTEQKAEEGEEEKKEDARVEGQQQQQQKCKKYMWKKVDISSQKIVDFAVEFATLIFLTTFGRVFAIENTEWKESNSKFLHDSSVSDTASQAFPKKNFDDDVVSYNPLYFSAVDQNLLRVCHPDGTLKTWVLKTTTKCNTKSE